MHGTDPFNLNNLPPDLPESQVFTSSLDDRKDFMFFYPDTKTIILDKRANTHISNDKYFCWRNKTFPDE